MSIGDRMDRSNIEKIAQSPEDRVLLAKLWDKIQAGIRRCIIANTCFLSPREQEMARYLFGAEPGLQFFGGYDDGAFRPGNYITRAEFASIAASFLGEEYEGEDLFDDISTHWARESINCIAAAGWVVEADDSFRPKDNITRAEVAKMINILLGRDAEKLTGDKMEGTDNAEGKWYYDFIRVASNSFDAETLEVIEVDADYWKNKKEEWAAAFAALIPEDESEDDEEIEG